MLILLIKRGKRCGLQRQEHAIVVPALMQPPQLPAPPRGLWGHPLTPYSTSVVFLTCPLTADGEGWSSAALWEDAMKPPLVCPTT